MSIAVYFYDSNAVKTREGLLTLDSGTGKYTYSNEQAQINQGDIDTNELCIVMPDALFDRADTGCFVSFVSPVRNPLGLIPGSWETRTIIIDTVETAYLNCAIIPLDLAFYTYVAGRYGFAGGFVNSSTGSIKKTVLGNYTVQNGVDNFTENELTASDYDNLLTAITNLTSGFGGRIADLEDYVANIIAGTQLLEKIALDTVSPSSTLNVGETRWNTTVKTLETKLNTEVTLQHGQELLAYLRNSETTTITNGTVVYVYEGTIGGSTHALMKRATTADSTAYKMIGVATQDILANQYGFVTLYGGMNLTTGHGFSAGDVLYLGVNGALTSTMPTAPTPRVKIGIVEPGDRLLVIPHIHYTLGMSSDVLISGQDNLSIIVWNATDARWQNTTKATFLSDCVQLGLVNTFTNTNYFTSGSYTIKIEPTTGAIEIYYISNLWAKIDKNGIYLNPTYITAPLTDNHVPSKGMVEGFISTHNLSSIAHNNLLLAIQAIEADILRLQAIGKPYGEIDYETAVLLALSESARNIAIEADIVSRYPTYVHADNDYVYDKGLVVDGIPTNYHVWKYNSSEATWVDEGIESAIIKASNDYFGIVKGNEYVSIISGIMQVLKADVAGKLGTDATYYTYTNIYDAIARLDIAEADIADHEGRITTAEQEIDALTDNVALIDDANLNESHSRMSPALLGTIIDGTPVSDAYWNGRLNEIRLKGLTLAQLIKNGNFVTTGNWTATSTTLTVADNIVSSLASAIAGGVRQSIYLIANHVYYFGAYVKSSSNLVYLNVYDGADKLSSAHSGSNNWELLQYTLTIATSGSKSVQVIRDNRTSAWNTVQAKNAILIDLTALGTHPTLGVAWSTLSASVVASYLGNYKTNAEIVAEQTTNLVTNGDFASDTVWTKGAGWTINATAIATASTANLAHTFAPTIGRIYYITYDAVVTSGTFAVLLGGVTGTTRTASGTYSSIITASSTAVLTFDALTEFTGTIDNVVLYDITDSARTSGLYSFEPLAITATDGTITRTLDLTSLGYLNSLPSGIKDEFDTYVDTTSGERVSTRTLRAARISLPTTAGYWTLGKVGATHTRFFIRLEDVYATNPIANFATQVYRANLPTSSGWSAMSVGASYTLFRIALPAGLETWAVDAVATILATTPLTVVAYNTIADGSDNAIGTGLALNVDSTYLYIGLPNATADTIGELYTYLAANPIGVVIPLDGEGAETEDAHTLPSAQVSLISHVADTASVTLYEQYDNDTHYFSIKLPNTTADTLSELYTYLGLNPITVVVPITEVVDTHAMGYLKQTGVAMTVDVTSSTFINEGSFSVKYVKDLQTVIDAIIASIPS